MTKVNVAMSDGLNSVLDAKDGISLMETLRDNGYDDVIALCGGIMACATCHIYVDEKWIEKVGFPSPEEAEILESSGFRKENSRLSCQIKVNDSFEGMSIALAPM